MNTELIEQLDALVKTVMVIVDHVKRLAAQGGPVADLRLDLTELDARVSRLEEMHATS